MVVGVCTYNRGVRILPTLRALAEMGRCGGRVTKIVIVDNRSSDDTARVVDGFINEHPGVPMLRLYEAKPGKPEAVRRLFESTVEPIVAMIDDDCVPHEGWAAAVLGLFDDEPRAGAVGGPVANLWESGPTRLARIYHRSLGDQLLGNARLLLDAPGGFLMGGAMAMRREAVEATEWLDHRRMDCRRGDRLEAGDDAELCIRIRQQGWEVWYEPDAAMGHLIPASRQTRAYLARLRESICRSEPWLRWLAHADCDLAYAQAQLARARRLYLKTLLFDWRPTRRSIRVQERLGRVRGWTQVVEAIRAGEVSPASQAAGESAPVRSREQAARTPAHLH